MKYYDPSKNIIILIKEKFSLKFLYKIIIGRIFLKIFIKPSFSRFNSILIKSSISKLFIKKFIKKNQINLDEYEKNKYNSFNDFFTRKKKNEYLKFKTNNNELNAICDAKLSCYEINEESVFKIKNSLYSVKELVKSSKLAKEYIGGTCLIFRLSVDDYHRYHFLDEGNLIESKKIDGFLHTVQPIAFDKYQVFSENQREVNVLKTKHFKKVVQIEVGALNVGKINNHKIKKFHKLEEKGYFSFGGSSIILLFKRNVLKIDSNILKYNKDGIEYKVKLGDKIGELYEKNIK